MFLQRAQSASTSVTKCIILYILCMMSAQLPMLIKGSTPVVPCVFFLGDSETDNGNNNNLITLAKVNYMPYGIDYPDGPTGRFTNGRNLPDFIAELLGFDKHIPPFVSARGPEILKGVNYGSGGAGILDESGFLQGERISMNRQLLNHAMTAFSIGAILGNASKGKEYLRKCLYCVNMGNNDYLNNYFIPHNPTRAAKYSPPRFAALLAKHYSQQLRTLYSLGARKIAIFGVGQLGCIPQFASGKTNRSSSGSRCNDLFNYYVQLFSNTLPPLVDTLNHDLPDAKFILVNATAVSDGDAAAAGFKVVDAPCCAVSHTGLCEKESDPCPNRHEYAFWDNYHPSEIFYRAMAKRAYNAESPSHAYPTDIRRLLQEYK